jgi:hypothetical protein
VVDVSALTIGQISSSLRDFAFVGGVITVVWKGRGVYETVKGFFQRTVEHMDKMEEGMQSLLSNHLFHIEKDLRNMASRQVRATERQNVEYLAADARTDYFTEVSAEIDPVSSQVTQEL